MAEETPKLYLTDVHLKGYKSIKDTKATFNEGINIIIGPNGSGKTNFLEFLNQTIDNGFVNESENVEIKISYEVKYENLLRLTLNVNYEVDEYFEKSRFFYRFKVHFAKYSIQNKQIFSFKNRVYSNPMDYEEDMLYAVANSKLSETIPDSIWPYLEYAISNFTTYIKYDLSREFIDLASPNNFSISERHSNGVNLYRPLYYNPLIFVIREMLDSEQASVKKKWPNLIPLIVDKFNTYFDAKYGDQIAKFTTVSAVRISNKIHSTIEGDELKVNFVLFEFKIGSEWLYWYQLSDGSRRVLAVMLQILSASQGPILLEEPELGLYPDQLQKLLTFIKEQSSRLQFIITTHSPDVLDILGIDELDKINICEMKGEEGTKIRKMTAKEKKAVKAYHEEFGVLSDYWRYENFGLSK